MKNEIRLLSAGAVVAAGLALGVRGVPAQEPGEQSVPRGQFAGMQRVVGEVSAVSGSTLTVKTEDGASMQILTTDNTRVMKGRGVTVKVADLKPGDGVTAAGNLDAPNKTLHAAIVFAVDAADVKKLKDNLGKTYITGKVTAIDLDNAKMTLERPDHVVQTIGFDETTSFKRGRGMRGGVMGMGAGAGPADSAGADSGESITLADIKVGDNVGGQGSVKNGTFVPTQLMVSTPGQGGRRRSGTGTVPGGAAGAGPTNN
jgi:predicted RNA-binding protein